MSPLPLRTAATLAALATGCALPTSRAELDEARSTRRIAVSGGAMALSEYPSSVGESGVLAAVRRPVWLSERGEVGQWELSPGAVVGGTGSGTALLSANFVAGAHVFLIPALSVEAFVGPMVGAQVGRAGATAFLGFQTHGAWVLHPFEDHRQRVKLEVWMSPAFALRTDPGNDCGACGGFYGVGLGYETAY